MTAAVSGLEFLNFDIAVQPLIQKKEREVFLFQYYCLISSGLVSTVLKCERTFYILQGE